MQASRLKYPWQQAVEQGVRTTVFRLVATHYPGAAASDGVVRHLINQGHIKPEGGISKKAYTQLRDALLLPPIRNPNRP